MMLKDWADANSCRSLYDRLNAVQGDAPGCHWEHRPGWWVPYGLAYGLVLEDGIGTDIAADDDAFDGLVRSVVNDSWGQLVPHLVRYRHAYGDLYRWFDPGLFSDNNDALETALDAVTSARSKWTNRPEESDRDDFDPYVRAHEAAWDLICTYWDAKEKR